MNTDYELWRARIALKEEEIYKTKSPEFIDGYDTVKEMLEEYLQIVRTDERERILREMGFDGDD